MSRLAASLLTVSLLALGVLDVRSAMAQITTINDTTSTPVEGVGHDYIKMLSETVNPANGSVSLRIQLPTAKGRGISLPFSIAYDTQGVNLLEQYITQYQGGAYWTSHKGYLSQGGWSYAVPMLSGSMWTKQEGTYPNWINCNITSSFVLTDVTGARHSLPIGWMYPSQLYGCMDANQSVT